MRINLLSLFSFLAFFGLSTTTLAQKNTAGIQIDLAGNDFVREKVYPTSSQTGLHICGLQKGETYTIYLIENDDTSGISTSSNGIFQKKITLTAQNSCQA